MDFLNLQALLNAAVEKLDMSVVVFIFGLTWAIRVADRGFKLERFYALIPIVLGIGFGFLIVTNWKNAILTGGAHGAFAMAITAILKGLFKLNLPGDKKAVKKDQK